MSAAEQRETLLTLEPTIPASAVPAVLDALHRVVDRFGFGGLAAEQDPESGRHTVSGVRVSAVAAPTRTAPRRPAPAHACQAYLPSGVVGQRARCYRCGTWHQLREQRPFGNHWVAVVVDEKG